MHVDLIILNFRNILVLHLLVVLVLAGNAPVVQQELFKIWKKLNASILPKPSRTNHTSNKFWEIDLTKFEP